MCVRAKIIYCGSVTDASLFRIHIVCSVVFHFFFIFLFRFSFFCCFFPFLLCLHFSLHAFSLWQVYCIRARICMDLYMCVLRRMNELKRKKEGENANIRKDIMLCKIDAIRYSLTRFTQCTIYTYSINVHRETT